MESAMQIISSNTQKAYAKRSWKEVPIIASKEPLISLPSAISSPYYSKVMNLGGGNTIYLRESVLTSLNEARDKLLSLGYDLQVYDGWRSVELQEELFWFYMKKFTIELFPEIKHLFEKAIRISQIKNCFYELPIMKQKLVKKANCEYVSWPSKDPMVPSPHSTGGAVDVWLYKDGKALDFGVPFDWMEDSAGAFYHLKKNRKRFPNDSEVCRNRTLLTLSMESVGFSCYPSEFWHFNLGNQMDGLVKNTDALYSYIEP